MKYRCSKSPKVDCEVQSKAKQQQQQHQLCHPVRPQLHQKQGPKQTFGPFIFFSVKFWGEKNAWFFFIYTFWKALTQAFRGILEIENQSINGKTIHFNPVQNWNFHFSMSNFGVKKTREIVFRFLFLKRLAASFPMHLKKCKSVNIWQSYGQIATFWTTSAVKKRQKFWKCRSASTLYVYGKWGPEAELYRYARFARFALIKALLKNQVVYRFKSF